MAKAWVSRKEHEGGVTFEDMRVNGETTTIEQSIHCTENKTTHMHQKNSAYLNVTEIENENGGKRYNHRGGSTIERFHNIL